MSNNDLEKEIVNETNTDDDSDITSLFESIYPFSTENISGYLELMNIKNRNILTVCGSGDQYLNLILHCANNVDVFDINPFTKMYLNLKIAAIKTLTKEEYLRFFCESFKNDTSVETNSKVLNLKSYRKLYPYLDEESRVFWDNLYLENTNVELANSLLFFHSDKSLKTLEKINDYLKDDNFVKLKIKLMCKPKVNFINTNLTKLSSELKGEYDYILLSNITDYLDHIFEKDSLIQFKNIITGLEKNMTENGRILLSYLYDCYDNYIDEYGFSEMYSKSRRDEVFDDQIEFVNIESIYGMKWYCQAQVYDAVVLYKKRL